MRGEPGVGWGSAALGRAWREMAAASVLIVPVPVRLRANPPPAICSRLKEIPARDKSPADRVAVYARTAPCGVTGVGPYLLRKKISIWGLTFSLYLVKFLRPLPKHRSNLLSSFTVGRSTCCCANSSTVRESKLQDPLRGALRTQRYAVIKEKA